MLLVIDNYDSFVYNLVQYLGELGEDIKVVRNDKIILEDLERLNPERIVLSPGPGGPVEAGICVEAIKYFSGKLPILGVCLGHQCIGEAYGAKVICSDEPVHGKTSRISHDGTGIFSTIPQEITVTRYHSLVLEKKSMPKELKVAASTEDGTVMAVKHKDHSVFGLQFHPESIASEFGKDMLENFLSI